MLDVCLLGTGGMMPLPFRYLTSALFRYNGSSLLIDCGEGTQVALRKHGFSANPVDAICFTHFHGDHISGLPGFLLTMGNEERKEPLLLIGPPGLKQVVTSLRVVAPELPFPILYKELSENEEDITVSGFCIHAFRVHHKVTCYGYTISIPRTGRFYPEEAKKREIPLRYWNRLQHGETVTDENGTVYTPDMVMGEDRQGLKVTYVTDTTPVDAIKKNAADSDLLICEGMYGNPEKKKAVREKSHMLMQEAAEIAAESNVKELWLTHFSPAETTPMEYAHALREIFPATWIPKDGDRKTLRFPEDEESATTESATTEPATTGSAMTESATTENATTEA